MDEAAAYSTSSTRRLMSMVVHLHHGRVRVDASTAESMHMDGLADGSLIMLAYMLCNEATFAPSPRVRRNCSAMVDNFSKDNGTADVQKRTLTHPSIC